MKKFIISGFVIGILLVYFTLTLYIFPQEFLSKPIAEPKPNHKVSLSQSEINLGASFDMEIITQNQNNQADILITSAGFPTLEVLSGQVKIINYDFTQPPRNIKIGDKIGSEYTFGNLVSSQYPSIEAYSRNVAPNTSYRLGIEVTPQSPGTFEIYIKTIAIPHTGEFSHFPYTGKIDSQSEFVSVYEIEVANP